MYELLLGNAYDPNTKKAESRYAPKIRTDIGIQASHSY